MEGTVRAQQWLKYLTQRMGSVGLNLLTESSQRTTWLSIDKLYASKSKATKRKRMNWPTLKVSRPLKII